jgi:hypothetical protein
MKGPNNGPSEPSVAVKKALFALSGNVCAFPGCSERMVDPDGTVRGRVCHIKGEKEGAARFDANQSPTERHGFHNLIVMCPNHHDEIDGPHRDKYPVDLLQRWKCDHEMRMGGEEVDPASIRIEGAEQVAVSQQQSGGVTANVVNISMPAPVGSTQRELSTDALHILFRAVNPLPPNDDAWKGLMQVFKNEVSTTYMVGGTKVKFNDPEHDARYDAAIVELVNLDLVENLGSTLKVTYQGYQKVKGLNCE